MTTKNVQKRKLQGVIVSDKMSKTRVVAVTRMKKHARYHKFYKVTKRYKAHDEQNIYKTGTLVIIEETRPISKGKCWTIVKAIDEKKNIEA